MSQFKNRLVRAAKLGVHLYEEVEADKLGGLNRLVERFGDRERLALEGVPRWNAF